MISIIVAMDDDQLIGKKDSSNGMPWVNKEDLKHFKETTINKTILMGYTTYQAIGRPLPNRKTIVVSFEPFDDERVEVRTSLEDVIEEYKQRNEDLFISGGASIYKQSLPLADQLLISRIPGHIRVKLIFLILMNMDLNWLKQNLMKLLIYKSIVEVQNEKNYIFSFFV